MHHRILGPTRARERALLAEVERALAKLDEGRYGVSEKTGAPFAATAQSEAARPATLDGKTITGLNLSRTGLDRDHNLLAFGATFSDGTQGLYTLNVFTGLRITSAVRTGADLQLSFTSQVGHSYTVQSFTYLVNGSLPGPGVPATPQIANRPLRISCHVIPESRNGVILAQGGRQNGYSLHLEDGRPVFSVRIREQLFVTKATTAPEGRFSLEATLAKDGAMRLSINGREAAKGMASGLIPAQPMDELSIGEDTQTAVGDYFAPNRLTGKVENVAERSAISTLFAILGRTAIYERRVATWKGEFGSLGKA